MIANHFILCSFFLRELHPQCDITICESVSSDFFSFDQIILWWTSSPARRLVGFLLLPSRFYVMYIVICMTDLYIFFSFHLFFLRWRWLKKRIRPSRHAKKRVRLYIPRKDHLLAVLHLCFSVVLTMIYLNDLKKILMVQKGAPMNPCRRSNSRILAYAR